MCIIMCKHTLTWEEWLKLKHNSGASILCSTIVGLLVNTQACEMLV